MIGFGCSKRSCHDLALNQGINTSQRFYYYGFILTIHTITRSTRHQAVLSHSNEITFLSICFEQRDLNNSGCHVFVKVIIPMCSAWAGLGEVLRILGLRRNNNNTNTTTTRTVYSNTSFPYYCCGWSQSGHSLILNDGTALSNNVRVWRSQYKYKIKYLQRWGCIT